MNVPTRSRSARALHKSEAWYLRQLKAGTLPGHRAGRTWALTATDIAAAIEHTATDATPSQRSTLSPPPLQPTRRAQRHLLPEHHQQQRDPGDGGD
ncbi:hypothetical protein ACWCP4_33645, partial [Nocardia elegans]